MTKTKSRFTTIVLTCLSLFPNTFGSRKSYWNILADDDLRFISYHNVKRHETMRGDPCVLAALASVLLKWSVLQYYQEVILPFTVLNMDNLIIASMRSFLLRRSQGSA